MTDDPETRTRAPAVGLAAERQARAAVAPTADRLAAWQIEAAHLRGQIERPGGSGDVDDGVDGRLKRLASEVTKQRKAMDAAVAELTPAARRSSRIADARRALDGLAATVAELRSTIAARRPGRHRATD